MKKGFGGEDLYDGGEEVEAGNVTPLNQANKFLACHCNVEVHYLGVACQASA